MLASYALSLLCIRIHEDFNIAKGKWSTIYLEVEAVLIGN